MGFTAPVGAAETRTDVLEPRFVNADADKGGLLVCKIICLIAPKHKRNCLGACHLGTSCPHFDRSKLTVTEVVWSSIAFIL